MPISACVITFNEEKNLSRCLDSLEGLVDEVVVVDSESSDGTRKLAEEAGARVVVQPWLGFVGQRNFALEQCRFDWIFSIDADEEVSAELRATLLDLKPRLGVPSEGETFAFALPRRVWYLNRWIWHGVWYPDYVIRLFYKPACRFGGGDVHETLIHPGKAERVTGDLLHFTYADRADHLARVQKYSMLWARSKFAQGKRSGALSCVSRPLFRFLWAYFVRAGFLDGWRGLQIAVICSYEVWLKYRFLRVLSRGGS